MIGGPYKRQDNLREKQAMRVEQAVEAGLFESLLVYFIANLVCLMLI